MADTKISALTAASTLDGTEIYPGDQSSITVGLTGAQLKAFARQAGSASAGSWPILGSGTVLTSPVAGAEEFDGVARYFSPASGARAVDLVEYFACLGSAYTLANSAAAQKIFNASSNGALTLPAALYLFDLLLLVTSMSATSGNAKIDLLGAGTATFGTTAWYAAGADGAVNTSAQTCSASAMTSSASAAAVVVAGAATSMQVSARGSFVISSPGTIIPSITLANAAAAIVAAGSYFRCRPIGGASAVSCGPWS